MSQENVEIVRSSQEYYTEHGDFAWELMSPQIEIHDHDLPDVPVYRGHAGLREWTAHWASAWQSWEMEAPEYVDAGERVVMLFTMRTTGRGSGVPLERKDAIVFRLASRRMTQIDYYNSHEEALKAVGVQ